MTLEYMTAIFKTSAHLEPQTSSKACQTYKMVRHIQSPDIIGTAYSSIFKIN